MFIVLWLIETLVTFSSFAFKSDTQNVVKTARLFLIRCLFRGRFLFQTCMVLHFLWKNLSRNSIFYRYCYSRTTKNEKQIYMLPFLTWVLLKAMFVLLKIFQTTDNWQFFLPKEFSGKNKIHQLEWRSQTCFFCIKVYDIQNLVNTAVLRLIRCLYRSRFLFQTIGKDPEIEGTKCVNG